MPRLQPHPSHARGTAATLQSLVHAWLVAGIALLAWLPTAQWQNHYVGALPYWLLVAPLISLALLRRHRLAAALSAFLVRGRRRRNLSRRRPVAAAAGSGRRRLARPAAALIGG